MKGLKSYIILTQIVLFSLFNVVLSNSTINKPLLAIRDSNFNLNTSDWCNATVISDDSTAWNTANSFAPSIAVDNNGIIHVVWYDSTAGEWGAGPPDWEIMYANYTAAGWSNATCISDIYGWNTGTSNYPRIAIDNNDVLHVVWYDNTVGEWGTDYEIMYVNYTAAGWSNATCISDIYGWNTASSGRPDIAIDDNNVIHVVWEDDTAGEWGGGATDTEIMYAKNTGSGWSNATVISDLYGWNNYDSVSSSIAVDNNSVIHVVWRDDTDGEWGSDREIMYVNCTGAVWSNATVISDDYTGWNIGASYTPRIAIDSNDTIHVVWKDETVGEWGGGISDREIMYTKNTGSGWSNVTIISDDYTGWNNETSQEPSIATCNNTIHVVWSDNTKGDWGTDQEILYRSYTATGWSNVICISDVYEWNSGGSDKPCIAIEINGTIHIVWQDTTNGEWGGGGSDYEIMYTSSFIPTPTPSKPADLSFLILLIGPEADSLPLILSLVLVGTAVAVIIVIIFMKKMKK